MQVYVLLARMTYENDCILGVYESVEACQKALQAKLDRDAIKNDGMGLVDWYNEFVAVPFSVGDSCDDIVNKTEEIELEW